MKKIKTKQKTVVLKISENNRPGRNLKAESRPLEKKWGVGCGGGVWWVGCGVKMKLLSRKILSVVKLGVKNGVWGVGCGGWNGHSDGDSYQDNRAYENRGGGGF